MRLEFDLNNNIEMPELVLGKRNYDKLGSIVNVDNLSYEYNLMSANSISFTVYKELNYEKERLWDEIKERRLIYLKEFDEWFQIDVITNDESGISKEVTGVSLCEAELSQIYIHSTEINTEDDIARDEYKNPTVFYKPSNPDESLLHRLLKVAPNYKIKHVDSTLYNIQRMFSIDNTTVYDALMGKIAEEIGCLFLFDSADRSISVYDMRTNCNHCGYRGDYTDFCPECGSADLNYGYGNDTTIFVDSETLAESISLSGKQEEVKNYIKVSGGDDLMNAAIAACNPTGTQYIYTWSDRDKEDMSEALLTKLENYLSEYIRLTPSYQDIMVNIYEAIDKQLELESNMMPDIEMAETNAQKELSKLSASYLSPIAVQDVSIASIYTVNNAVLGMAKCIVNSTVYKIEIVDSSLVSQTWRGKFRLTNNSDDEDTAENTGYITIAINDDYAYYIEQKIRKTIDRDDVYLVDIFDSKTDLAVFKAELKKYCLNRLTSFESAYQSVIDVMIEANCANDSSYGDIYHDLYLPYYEKLTAIQKEIIVRISEIEVVDARLTDLEESRKEITEYLNLEKYLGNTLWEELCSFRREDSFENNNYISDGLDNSELLQKAQELLNKAKTDAVTASTLQLSLSTTMFNLLAIPEFQKLTGMFEGGNWIRVGMDDKIYRLRLVHFKIDFTEIQNLEVEFSDVSQTVNGLNDSKSLMDKVGSLASSFGYVAHQAEQGSKGFTELNTIRNDGLNAALYHISTSINQDFIIDEHGITGRQWDDILGDYLPEQVKFTNNCLVYTDDYWVTAKAALGKIEYYNPILKETISQYGILCEAVLSGILMGNDIIGGHIYSENYSSTTGTHINLNNGDFSFAGGKLTYDSNKDVLNLTGKITFESIDYSSNNTKNIIKESLGLTAVEENLNAISDDISSINKDILSINNDINDSNLTLTNLKKCLGFTTEISSDYVISPYIGGGYLNISNASNGAVIIDPSNVKKTGYIFGIYNSSGSLVTGVDTSGNAIFSGKIVAAEGSISGWTIGKNAIYRTSPTFGASGGMYFGTSGLSISDTFKVTSNGTVTANGSFATGTDGTYAKLSDGNLTFYKNSSPYSAFGTSSWANKPTYYGTTVHSEYNSKFISFGNKDTESATTYTTKFVINYGLNPDGRTQGILIYDSLYVSGGIDLRHDDTNNVSISATYVTSGWYALKADGIYTPGNLYVGGDKNRIIKTDHYGTVCLSAYETTTPYFGDIGSGICDDDGLCYIYLDEIFKETVIMDYKYYVFLQAIGESEVWLVEQNEDYFVVKGQANQEFNFEIKCRQKGTESNRLDSVYFEESEDYRECI